MSRTTGARSTEGDATRTTDGLGPERRIGFGRDHQRLGAGDLDLPRFLDRLTAAGFAGPLVFELTVEEALASLEVVRAVRPGLLPPARLATPAGTTPRR